MSESAAIVLAAGRSTRMKSDLPKALHELCGRPMLSHVLGACRLAGVGRLLAVVGYGKKQVLARFKKEKDITWVEQAQQRGTGHAVLCSRDALRDFSGDVLVVAGDMPLVRRETLANLIECRRQRGDAVTLATTMLDDPTGYGRIIRDDNGDLEAIVEHGDCSATQREIEEVNPSYYCFDARRLFAALDQVRPAGTKGEYYVTDAIRVLRASGHGVSAVVQVPPEDALGINSRLDLATVSRVLEDRIQLSLLDEGVTIVDPDNTWIESEVSVGRETVIYPFTLIRSGATIGEGCRIGPFAEIKAGDWIEDGSVVGSMMKAGARTS